MEKLIKDKIVLIILPGILIALMAFLLAAGPEQTSVSAALGKGQEISAKQNDVQTKQEKLEILKQQSQKGKEEKKKESKSGKVIYEISGQQFSPEASFGIMFENLLANITNSGVRIRSIDYNYTPDEDRILSTGLTGYNACELSFLAVGNYSQLQTFFKNIAKENYLSSIYEVYIEPYDNDKTILIARFKIRLYTRTI